MFLANNFALPDAENNTSGPLNRGGLTDLPLLRTLLAICHDIFWGVSIKTMNDCDNIVKLKLSLLKNQNQ